MSWMARHQYCQIAARIAGGSMQLHTQQAHREIVVEESFAKHSLCLVSAAARDFAQRKRAVARRRIVNRNLFERFLDIFRRYLLARDDDRPLQRQGVVAQCFHNQPDGAGFVLADNAKQNLF